MQRSKERICLCVSVAKMPVLQEWERKGKAVGNLLRVVARSRPCKVTGCLEDSVILDAGKR